MSNEILEDLEIPSETIVLRKKEYKIEGMNCVDSAKAMQILPMYEFFKDPLATLIGMVSKDAMSMIKVAHIAAPKATGIIDKLYPHELVYLFKAVFRVNKPSFFLAWKMVKNEAEQFEKDQEKEQDQLNGTKPSKNSSVTDTGERTSENIL